MFIVYILENHINHKKYIGYAKDYKSRKSRHFSGLKNNSHENQLIQNDFNLCGTDAFTIDPIACTTNVYNAKRVEHLLIVEHRTLDYDYGYNKSTYLGWGPEPKMRDCERKYLRGGKYRLILGTVLEDPINRCLVCTFKPN